MKGKITMTKRKRAKRKTTAKKEVKKIGFGLSNERVEFMLKQYGTTSPGNRVNKNSRPRANFDYHRAESRELDFQEVIKEVNLF